MLTFSMPIVHCRPLKTIAGAPWNSRLCPSAAELCEVMPAKGLEPKSSLQMLSFPLTLHLLYRLLAVTVSPSSVRQKQIVGTHTHKGCLRVCLLLRFALSEVCV